MTHPQFIEAEARPDPFDQFRDWYESAQREMTPEPTAMAVATVDGRGQPSVRMVLLKGYDRNGFVFYTNFQSRKSAELALNPQLSLLFWWPQNYRQVRIEGVARPVSPAEADAYFASRARGSQIGAWASPQSSEIPDRNWLDAHLAEIEAQYANGPVPRPPHWSGYRVAPTAFEFWQGRDDRLHDRLCYHPDGDGWRRSRIAP